METCFCKICKIEKTDLIWNLGEQFLGSRFPKLEEGDPPKSSLILVKCSKCGLVQLNNTVESSELYFHQYGYRSGINSTMRNHLKGIVEYIRAIVSLSENDVVLDIGSNDSTLLNCYSEVRKVGIDPTGKQFKEFYNSETLLVSDFFTAKTYYENISQKAKVVTSICVLYDLPDPVAFAKDVHDILTDDGIWVTEQSYILDMLDSDSFDTICHEHLEYYGFKQVADIADKAGLKILNVTRNSSNGGSFRLTLCKKECNLYNINEDNIDRICQSDKRLEDPNILLDFVSRCEKVKTKITSFLDINKQRSIYLYGASTKGNTLLQYFNITNKQIIAAADRNPEKNGRRTPGTNIPIISEEEMREKKPDILIVLPWHFRDEFVVREDDYLKNGGMLVFPLPKFEVVSHCKRAIITGINGQIGSYLHNKLLFEKYIIFGINRDNRRLLSDMIKSIQPNEIYDLASESNTLNSFNNPLRTFDDSRIMMEICQTVQENNIDTKIFHASSPEIYKDRSKSLNIISEDSPLQSPLTPYCVSKLTSYNVIEFYRNYYNLNIIRGIIFNTESPLRKDNFLLKKVCNFIKTIEKDKLKLGNINSQKDWLHASDVVDAIHCIMISEKNKEDFVISRGEGTQIKYMLDLAFKQKNLNWKDFVDVDETLFRNFEHSEEILIGNNQKLRSLGWKPKISVEEILVELLA